MSDYSNVRAVASHRISREGLIKLLKGQFVGRSPAHAGIVGV
jgi:hypothetical protein